MILSTGLGLIVGGVLALTGAGGEILAVPLLVFGVGLSVAEAEPIGLLAVGIAATLGAALGLKAGSTVRYRAALLVAGAGMLFVAYRTFRQTIGEPLGDEHADGHTPPCIRDADSGRFVWTTRCARALALSGSVAGLLSGLLGVGGGFVTVTALQRYTDLAMPSVLATSLAVIALASITGVASSAIAGYLNWAVALPFSAGALAGMLGGRLVSSRIAGPQLQKGFAVTSSVVAIGMIVKSLA